MSQETPTLEASQRERLGTRYSRRLRREGRLPAVVYGHGIDPVHVTIDQEMFTDYLHDGAHVVSLQTEGGNVETCLIKSVQYDHLGDTIIHVDLTRIDLNEEVTVSVPLTLKGKDKSPGAKAPNAIVEQPLVDLEVECLANNIPDEILVDISAMELNTVIHIRDLKLPQGVTTEEDPDTIVVSIHETKEVTEEELEAAPEAEDAEPEVLTERKEEDESDEGQKKEE